MPSSSSRFAASILSLGLLGLAWGQILSTTRASPAFNQDLQVQTITGGHRPVALSSMYDRAEYLFQVAYGASNAPLLRFEDPKLHHLATAEDPRAAWRLAREAARASLSQAPSDAYAWLVLASAEMSLDHDRQAMQALSNAAMFAPNALDITAGRANLGAILYQSAPDLADDLAPILARDIALLARHDAEALADLAAIFPDLADLLPPGPEKGQPTISQLADDQPPIRNRQVSGAELDGTTGLLHRQLR